VLSPAGTAAADTYRAAVQGARGGGRSALDAALTGWATPLAVAPGDGVLLVDLASAKPRGLADVTAALEDAGIPPAEVRLGLDRLVKAGLVSLVPLASQVEKEAATAAAARPPTRWRY
jgi:hypothetical protein